MLELKNIQKTYAMAGEDVHALKGISLKFKERGFVSILGPSGCGKTTLLNIIGGLDQYSSGDLIINGVSTRQYKDRDWDTYRNHSIGFVFQSYNLIPHQSVLQNVELALTLSGVPARERYKRAKAALEQVGLGNQLRKKPAEMSGGQMQRVAIARAIVNDPDIILADEPTGALDTETSLQVMEILKAISKEHLVIMVTHNPDLAYKYSTRIIKMLDGLVINDSENSEDNKPSYTFTDLNRLSVKVPDTGNDEDEKFMITRGGKVVNPGRDKGRKKPSMSLMTSFGLSLKNLFSKKGRTILTSFAGSIGIIGIALIYAVSRGMTGYIDVVQEQTLSSYPLQLTKQSADFGSLLEAFIDTATSGGDHEDDAVYEKSMMSSMITAIGNMDVKTNDLGAFKAYLLKRLKESGDDSSLDKALSAVQYTYDLDFSVYTENAEGNIVKTDPRAMMQTVMADYMGRTGSDDQENSRRNYNTSSSSSPFFSMSGGMGAAGVTLWQEIIPGKDGEVINDLLKSQYEMVAGSWPKAYDEIVMVLDENNELSDIMLYALGLIPKEDIEAIVQAAADKTESPVEPHSFSYDEIMGKTYKVFIPSQCYRYDEGTDTWTDLRESDTGLKMLYANGLDLKITGIIRPDEDAIATVMSGAVGYTSLLTEYIISQAAGSDACRAQEENPETDIFTGLRFKDNGDLSEKEKAEIFTEYVNRLTDEKKAEIYKNIRTLMPEELMNEQVDALMQSITREEMEQNLITAASMEMGLSSEEIESYMKALSDNDLKLLYREVAALQVKQQYAAGIQKELSGLTDEELTDLLLKEMETYREEEKALYYDQVLEFSDSTYEDNLIRLGMIDLNEPSSINLFASSFENKDILEEEIAAYNESVEETERIDYTDYVGLMMSSITTIINAITYVLIAFVAISLVVSSIMIGVITLISVQERTKEIGILRAVGASKRNVSSMFNAETMIIGFASGLTGIIITYLLLIPINLILHKLTGINNLSAYLPWEVALILVLVSMFLTLIAGIIPSRSAAKKDPVVALRTE